MTHRHLLTGAGCLLPFEVSFDLFTKMSAFPHLPIGAAIPPSPHAVSCSLPTMHSVRGYEEKSPEIIRQLATGYPRFVVHPFALQLAAHYVATNPALAGHKLWLTSSLAVAENLVAHLSATSAGAAHLFVDTHGLHGVAHPAAHNATYALAKTYLQNLGGFLSSREAEDHLVRLGLRAAVYPEATFAGDAPAEIRRHGAHVLIDASTASLYNLDVLPHADIALASLTKYTGSVGDLTAGLAVVNPDRPDAPELRRRIALAAEPLYARDAARLAHEIADTKNVLEKIHASTPRVVAFLENHPAVKDVYWARHAASVANFEKLARHPHATGGLITFSIREIGGLEKFYDRLRLPKGPSFGMTTTLICPFMYLAHYDLVTTPAGLAELSASNLDPDLLRLCVGCEPVEEIIEALREALEHGTAAL